MRSSGQSQRDSRRTLSLGRLELRLSGGVGAGAGAVTPAARRSGAGAAARRRAPPRGARSSPHARRTATPHGWRRRHPARGRKSPGGRTNALRQHSRRSDFLPVDLTSVHVLEGLLGLLRGLKLHIGRAPGQVWVESIHWHFYRFDFPIC